MSHDGVQQCSCVSRWWYTSAQLVAWAILVHSFVAIGAMNNAWFVLKSAMMVYSIVWIGVIFMCSIVLIWGISNACYYIDMGYNGVGLCAVEGL